MATRLLSVARPSITSNNATHPFVVPTRSATNKSKQQQPDPNTEMPGFSFKDLGASPAVKAIVYAALGVIGTAETYFWCRWGWEKYGPRGESPDVGEGS